MFVELLGEAGAASGRRPLLPPPPSAQSSSGVPPPPFARGGCDVFALRLPRLGALAALRVSTDGRGGAWHLDFVSVQEGPAGGGELGA